MDIHVRQTSMQLMKRSKKPSPDHLFAIDHIMHQVKTGIQQTEDFKCRKIRSTSTAIVFKDLQFLCQEVTNQLCRISCPEIRSSFCGLEHYRLLPGHDVNGLTGLPTWTGTTFMLLIFYAMPWRIRTCSCCSRDWVRSVTHAKRWEYLMWLVMSSLKQMMTTFAVDQRSRLHCHHKTLVHAARSTKPEELHSQDNIGCTIRREKSWSLPFFSLCQ